MTLAHAALLVADAESVMLTSHLNPDGDGLGSVLALRSALLAVGKRVRVCLPGPEAPARLWSFLPGFDSCEVITDAAKARRLSPVDLLISCDCGDIERLGPVAAARRTTLLNLDHHRSNQGFGDCAIVDLTAAATVQVVEALLRRLDLPITAEIATCLYTGLVFDTGRFLHGNTDAKVFACANRLAKADIDIGAINRAITYQRSSADLTWQRIAIESLERDGEDPRLCGIAIPKSELAAHEAPGDWGDLIDLARSLSGVEAAWLIREQGDGSCRVSLRSNPPVAVGTVAEALGGGGHAQAAGCTVPGTLAEVRREIIARMRVALAT